MKPRKAKRTVYYHADTLPEVLYALLRSPKAKVVLHCSSEPAAKKELRHAQKAFAALKPLYREDAATCEPL